MFEKVEPIMKQYHDGLISATEAILVLTHLKMECNVLKLRLAVEALIQKLEEKAYEVEAKQIRDLEKLI